MKPLLTVHADAFGSAGHYCVIATSANGDARRKTQLGETAIVGIGSSDNLVARLHNFTDKPQRLADLGIGTYQVFAQWEDSDHLPLEREKFFRSIFPIAHGQFPELDGLQAGGNTAYVAGKKTVYRRFSSILEETMTFVCDHSDDGAEARIKEVLGQHIEWRAMIASTGSAFTPELCDIGLILQESGGPARKVTHVAPVVMAPQVPLVWVWERSEAGWKRCDPKEAEEHLRRTIF